MAATRQYATICTVDANNNFGAKVWPFTSLVWQNQTFIRGAAALKFVVGSPTTLVQGNEIRVRLRAKSYVGQFNGSSQYITISPAVPTITNSTTITAWFKTSTATGTPPIVCNGYVGSTAGFVLRLNAGKVEFDISDGTHTATTSSVATYSDNKWHFAVAKFTTGASIALQVDDGTPTTATTVVTSVATTQPYYIGYDGTNYWNGYLSDIRQFNEAISSANADNLWIGYSYATNLAGQWKLTQSGGTSVYDSSNNACGGTASNAWYYDSTSPYMSAVAGGYITVVQPDSLQVNLTGKDYSFDLQNAQIAPVKYYLLAPDVIAREMIYNTDIAWANKTVTQAVKFDGSSGYYTITPSSSIAATSFSISFWYNTAAASGSMFAMTTNTGSGTAPQFTMAMSGGKLQAMLYDTAPNNLTAPNTSNDSTWHHAGVKYDGTTLTLFQDGAIVKTLTHAYSFANFTGIKLGNDWGEGLSYGACKLDEVNFWAGTASTSNIIGGYLGAPQAETTKRVLWLNSSTVVTSALSGLTVGNWMDRTAYANNGVPTAWSTGITFPATGATGTIDQIYINALASDAITQLLKADYADAYVDGNENFYYIDTNIDSGVALALGTNGFLDTWTKEDNLFYNAIKLTGALQQFNTTVTIAGSAVVNKIYSVGSGFSQIGITLNGATLSPNVDYTPDTTTGIIKFTNQPAAGDSIVITYTYNVPIQANAYNYTSIDTYGERDLPYNDTSITSTAAAQTVADELLNYYSTIQYQGDFQMNGFYNNAWPTQLVQVNDTFRKIYQKCQVVSRQYDFTHGQCIYTVGTYYRQLFDFNQIVRQKLLTLTQIVSQSSTLSRFLSASSQVSVTGSALLNPNAFSTTGVLKFSNSATLTTAASGSFVYGTATYGFSDYA